MVFFDTNEGPANPIKFNWSKINWTDNVLKDSPLKTPKDPRIRIVKCNFTTKTLDILTTINNKCLVLKPDSTETDDNPPAIASFQAIGDKHCK